MHIHPPMVISALADGIPQELSLSSRYLVVKYANIQHTRIFSETFRGASIRRRIPISDDFKRGGNNEEGT